MAFYITAPSNSSMELYPENTLTNYTVHLPRQIDLDGPYEVALTTFQYTRSWNNVSEDFNQILFSINGLEMKTKIPIGFYETEYELLNGILDSIMKAMKKMSSQNTDMEAYLKECELHQFFQFVYKEKSRRVAIYLRMQTSITFHPRMSGMLGYEKTHFDFIRNEGHHAAATSGNDVVEHGLFNFEEVETKEENLRVEKYVEVLKNNKTPKRFHAENEIDLEQGLYMLCVYCNILEEQIVGDTMVPLLKIVAVEGRHGQNITREYINPQYVPVFMTHFSELEIDIRDDAGARVPFERGRVLATLHFRRKSEL
jgi:hypothetical protein